MRIFILLFIITGIVNNVIAQKECSKTMSNHSSVLTINKKTSQLDLGENDNPYGGTFQFIISENADHLEVFTDNILTLIEENRLENDENIVVLSPYTRVRILSRNQINKPGFQPLTKLYIIE